MTNVRTAVAQDGARDKLKESTEDVERQRLRYNQAGLFQGQINNMLSRAACRASHATSCEPAGKNELAQLKFLNEVLPVMLATLAGDDEAPNRAGFRAPMLLEDSYSKHSNIKFSKHAKHKLSKHSLTSLAEPRSSKHISLAEARAHTGGSAPGRIQTVRKSVVLRRPSRDETR